MLKYVLVSIIVILIVFKLFLKIKFPIDTYKKIKIANVKKGCIN